MNYNEAFALVGDLIRGSSAEKPIVIAIDGRSASGKTTFAQAIADKYSIPIIHTDDFCRPRDKNGNLNITEFDGNFDIERFKLQVVDKLNNDDGFDIGVFNCKKGSIDKVVKIPRSQCYLVEGAYSHNPKLGAYATVRLFFTIGSELQKKRILKRNGSEALDKYLTLWIPAEERYFAEYQIIEKSDYYINN